MDSLIPTETREERRDDSLRTAVTPDPSILAREAEEQEPTIATAPSDDPPDGGLTAWLTIMASFLLNFVDLGFSYGFGVYQEQYKLREFSDVSVTQIDLIGSICMALSLFLGAFMARPCQRFGMRAVAVLGSIILFVGTLSAGFCTSVPTLIVTQGIIQGAGAGILFIPGAAIPAQWFSKRRALAIGIGSSGAGLGGVFWSLVGRLLISRFGREWALRISAFVNLGLCAIAIIFLNERKTRATRKEEGEKKEPILDRNMFRDPVFAVLYCGNGVSVFGYLVPFFYLPTFASTRTGCTPFLASLLLSMMNLGSAVGRIIFGAIADTRVGRFNTVLIGMAWAGASQWLFWSLANVRGSYGLSMVFAIVYGLCGGGYIGIFHVILAHVFDPTRLAALTGLFFTSELLGQTTGGPIAGAILQNTGEDWYPMIGYSGASLVMGALLGWMAKIMFERREKREREEGEKTEGRDGAA
ncbi:MFS general substrate transporter [Calocera cornea HHB12733]|uniref:MFS general substrate transporter n=1 Tax=Calocera cornea HHB12733 TaxID=1353952 RepID=A0A165G4M5_9BASI|nr:MFS general substrate transporter [Calocera cornea HHB12733]